MEETFKSAIGRLNDNQLAAASHTYGPALVISGPGTGKTQTLAIRVGILIQSDLQVAPNEILCLTFTDAGVVAMRERIVSLIGPEGHQVAIHTFHSFCNSIIQTNPDFFGIRDFKPISEIEETQILSDIIDSLPIENPLKRIKGDKYFEVSRMRNLYRIMKDELLSGDYIVEKTLQYIEEMPTMDEYIYKRANKTTGVKAGDIKENAIVLMKEKLEKLIAAANLYDLYLMRMREAMRYDFSDMINWVIKGLESSVNFLRIFQERYQWVMVDEFQDTNAAQNKIVELLLSAWDSPNILVIGDDDQGIYEFQGARVANIFRYIQKYNPVIIPLIQNYRSTPQILSAATKVIKNNTLRVESDQIDKTLLATNKRGKPVSVLAIGTPMEESVFIAQSIKNAVEAGTDPNGIAVIYRKHRQADDLLRLLESMEIPCYVKKRRDIFESPVVRWCLLLMDFMVNCATIDDNKVWTDKLMFLPFWSHATPFADSIPLGEIPERMNDDVKTILIRTMTEFESLPLNMAFYNFVVNSGLLSWVRRYNKDLFALRTFWDFLNTECEKNPMLSLEEFMEFIRKMIANKTFIQEGVYEHTQNGVTLTTCHGAKGLEWETVFLMGCTKNEWESSRGVVDTYAIPSNIMVSSEEDTLEANRRLFFVACTRAKKELVVTYARKNADGKDLERSVFVDELECEISEYAPIDTTPYLLTPKPMVIQSSTRLEEAFLKERLSNYALSPTDFIAYHECSLRFWHEKILRIPEEFSVDATYGVCIHRALEEIQSGVEKVISMFLLTMEKSSSIFGSEFRNWISMGEEHLRAYMEDTFIPANCKHEYMVKRVIIGGVPCKGRLDRLDIEGQEVDIIDYKTGGKASFEAKTRKGGNYWLSGLFYDLLIRNLQFVDWYPAGAWFHLVSDTPMRRRIEYSQEERNDMIDAIASTYSKIVNKQLDHQCGECFWCKLRKYSQA